MVIKQYQLRALVAIADCGSIRSAAESLHLTQPAITKAIRDLEAELGLMLLVRGARGVTLTAEGRVLLARARMIGRELERAEEELRALKEFLDRDVGGLLLGPGCGSGEGQQRRHREKAILVGHGWL